MYNYDYPKELSVGRVTLEISLKPFKKLDEEYVSSVIRTLFEEWKPLIRHATGVSVMFWTSDGSEILDYSGNIEDEFEWGKYIGIGNPKKVERIPGTVWDDERYLHVIPVVYTENPPVMTYSALKLIISKFKEIGKQMTGFDITVGETFDPGPEFAYSEFKFERHSEINKGRIMNAWVHCAAKLHGDTRKYAAYPNGIPEGTQLGEFLAKQFACLKKDVGFDYLWLSNGFGFSLDSWHWVGELFDSKEFNFKNAANVRESIKEFWDSYTPNTDFVTEVRGSNLSTAMDISAHGCPIDEIYKNNIIAPPNSPWAAIDTRFGLELVGYMSHIAMTPKNGYSFRYYIHDPWWKNSPWFDRYGRSPHDIYMPLTVARMDKNGKADRPGGINFLSADDSFGNIPVRLPNEVIPHLLEAYRTAPDAPGLITWLYPFEYYCKLGLYDGKVEAMFMDDWLIEGAVDMGLPLGAVVSDGNFLDSPVEPYLKTIILCPVPEADSILEKCVIKAIDAGIKVLLYGNTKHASDKIKSIIGVKHTDGVSGELTVTSSVYKDTYEADSVSDKLVHVSVVSNGDIIEISDGTSEVVASVMTNDGKTRAYATCNNEKSVAWVRGSFPHQTIIRNELPVLRTLSDNFSPSLLVRCILSKLGLGITFEGYSTKDKLPLVLTSGYKGGYYFTSYSKDETVITKMTTDFGAPIINNTSSIVENDIATYNLPKWMHEECRFFVKQKNRSKITHRSRSSGDTMYTDRCFNLYGFDNADITFMPEKGTKYYFYDTTGRIWGDSSIDYTVDENGYAHITGLSGDMTVTWIEEKTYEEYRRLGYIKE